MEHISEAFVGFDTSKMRNAVAVAESSRDGEIRYLGEIDNTEAGTRKLVARLEAQYQRLTFCYEAGPTGYGLYRLIESLGHDCIVIAPFDDSGKARRAGQDQSARCGEAGKVVESSAEITYLPAASPANVPASSYSKGR